MAVISYNNIVNPKIDVKLTIYGFHKYLTSYEQSRNEHSGHHQFYIPHIGQNWSKNAFFKLSHGKTLGT